MKRTGTSTLKSSRLLCHSALIICALALAASASGEPGRLLILHTNDMHDHLRPGYIGIGGMPYVSGFVRSIRAERDDVLLLDAGDLLEKGDLLAYTTHGLATFEAMGRIGYDAVTIGNHDLDFGVRHLRRLEQALGQPLLLLNLLDRSGEPVFQPSRIVEVNDIKIGIIGMLAPRKQHLGGLDHEASGRALAAEAERLREQVDLVIALCHQGIGPVQEWSRMAPAVDVFVAGHDHKALLTPLVVADTGAIVVSAGSDAHWVGHLELEVDLEARRVSSHAGGLTLLRHDRIPVDADMLNWLQAQETALVPQADDFVIDLERPLGWFALARLAADAVRQRARVDVAFYHPTQIVRNGLPAGPLDHNAIFRISAERVDPLLLLAMTGQEISEYMNALGMSDWGQTQWAGFTVRVSGADTGRARYDNDLDPNQIYQVVMPEREWQRYLIEVFEPAYVRTRPDYRSGHPVALPPRNISGEPLDFMFADAFSDYLRDLAAAGESIDDRLRALRQAQGDANPDETYIEPRFEQPLSPEYFLEQEGAQ